MDGFDDQRTAGRFDMTKLAGQGVRSRAEALVLQRPGLPDYVYEKAMGYGNQGPPSEEISRSQPIQNKVVNPRLQRTRKWKKMLEMKDEPTISMKTQGRATKCHVAECVFHKDFSENRGFCGLLAEAEK